MAVYVDPAVWPYRNMIMAHMWADGPDWLNELMTMADTIKVQRKWIQGHPILSLPQYRSASWVHFDIASGKRELAIKNGAIATDRWGCIEHTAKLAIASGHPDRMAYGHSKLEQIARRRQLTLDPL